MRVYLCKLEGSSQLNGILLPTELDGLLYGKDYRYLDVVFYFFFAYADTCMDSQDDTPLNKVYVQYTELKNCLMTDNDSDGQSSASITTELAAVSNFERSVRELFGPPLQ